MARPSVKTWTQLGSRGAAPGPAVCQCCRLDGQPAQLHPEIVPAPTVSQLRCQHGSEAGGQVSSITEPSADDQHPGAVCELLSEQKAANSVGKQEQ